MKEVNKNKHHHFHLRNLTSQGGALLSLAALSILGVGFSSWVIYQTNNSINVDGLEIAAADVRYENYQTSSFLHLNITKGNKGIDPLAYNSKGFVDDEMVSSKEGHLTFYLVFEVSKYNNREYNPSPYSTVNFSFNLSYKEDNDSYTLLDKYLSSCTCSHFASNTSTSAYQEDIYSSNVNNILTSDNLDVSNDTSSIYYLTLDYLFDVGEDFEAVKSNELVNKPTFLLTAEVKGN